MKNSFYSDNFICLINAIPQALKKPVERISFIDEVPATSDLYECLLKEALQLKNVYWPDETAEKEDTA